MLQAYAVPDYFRDDWLNDYHDMCRAARSAADSASQSGANALGTVAACDDTDGDGVNSETQPHAPSLAPSRLADSDYRFVYLGPKVTGLSAWLSCVVWCHVSIAGILVLT